MGPTSSKPLPYKTPVTWHLWSQQETGAGIPRGLGLLAAQMETTRSSHVPCSASLGIISWSLGFLRALGFCSFEAPLSHVRINTKRRKRCWSLKFDALDSGWKPHKALGCWAAESCCRKTGSGEDFYSSASCGNQGDKISWMSQPVTSLPTNAMGTVHMAAIES